MIETVWSYVAVMLLAAGLFPSLESRFRWRIFAVLPPIVLTYLLVMALAVAGLWSATPEVQATQRAVTALILPALLFLLMVNCDLRAILAVGPARARGVRLRDGEHPARHRRRLSAVSRRAAGRRLEDARRAERHLDRRFRESRCGQAEHRSFRELCCRPYCSPMRWCIRSGSWCCSPPGRSRRPSIAGRALTRGPIRNWRTRRQASRRRPAACCSGWASHSSLVWALRASRASCQCPRF